MAQINLKRTNESNITTPEVGYEAISVNETGDLVKKDSDGMVKLIGDGITEDVFITPFKKLTIENGSITSFDEGEWTYEGVMTAGEGVIGRDNFFGFNRTDAYGSLNPDETDIIGVYWQANKFYININDVRFLQKIYIDGITYYDFDFRQDQFGLGTYQFNGATPNPFVTGQTYDIKIQYLTYD